METIDSAIVTAMVSFVTLGERIADIRKRRGMSAYKLAQIAKMGQSQLAKIEKGSTESPRGKTLRRLADALGETVDFLETGVADPKSTGTLRSNAKADQGLMPFDAIALPVVAEAIAAGPGTIPLLPITDRPYFFREDFLARKGWTRETGERFVCIKLGDVGVAESMYPTIQQESLLLVDREPDVMNVPARSIWWVRLSKTEEAVKRVTIRGRLAILESDNPDPDYAPHWFEIPTKEERTGLLKARVIWYATDIEPKKRKFE
jgi:transcriptional regulator with XRE-family HTH domain